MSFFESFSELAFELSSELALELSSESVLKRMLKFKLNYYALLIISDDEIIQVIDSKMNNEDDDIENDEISKTRKSKTLNLSRN